MDIESKSGSLNITNKKIVFSLLSLYFILKPFYFWESGLPQIADFIMALMVIVYLNGNRYNFRFYKESRNLICLNLFFISYILIINAVWAIMLDGELDFIKMSAFYIYNFLASVMILIFYYEYKEQLLKVIYTSVLASIIILFAAYFLNGGFTGRRAVAFFNNPNQLGYHSLLTLAILLFMNRKTQINFAWFIIGVASATVLCFASLSKAAIVSYAGMLMYFILIRRKNKIFTLKMFICMLLAALLFMIIFQFNSDFIIQNGLVQGVNQRIETIGQSDDDNLYARGYDRIINNPQYLVFGAGEGAYSRFSGEMELHSTLGNILMSYGIVGIGIYSASLFIAFKQNRWKDLYLLAFIMAYGLTHNGIRNTLLWILIALISVDNINRDGKYQPGELVNLKNLS